MSTDYNYKLRKVIKGRTMIFIDAANLERSVRCMKVNTNDGWVENNRLCWRVNYRAFNQFFKNICNLCQIYFYSANFASESHNNFLGFLKRGLKFKLRTKPVKEYEDHTLKDPHRKANFDVELAVDATYFINKFDTFILFSGDCDFEYLLKFLRGKNKITIVFSRKGHVSKELVRASNYYFDVANFRLNILSVK